MEGRRGARHASHDPSWAWNRFRPTHLKRPIQHIQILAVHRGRNERVQRLHASLWRQPLFTVNKHPWAAQTNAGVDAELPARQEGEA